MTDNYAQPNKSATFKKYGAALGVAGITVAAALLLAGRSKAPVQMPTNIIEMSEDIIDSSITELSADSSNCMNSFNRFWAENGNSLNSTSIYENIDSKGYYQDPTFPADSSSLYMK